MVVEIGSSPKSVMRRWMLLIFYGIVPTLVASAFWFVLLSIVSARTQAIANLERFR